MEREFVTYEQALALKDLGFDELYCFGYYDREQGNKLVPALPLTNINTLNGDFEAPLKQQVFRLFREKYNYWSYVYPYIHDKTWHFHVQFYDSDMWGEVFLGNNYSNYEEAENACIDKLLEIVKEQKKIDLIADISGW